MPIYEYRCSSCGNEFEKLVRSTDTPECPSCHGHALDKKLSSFATASSAASTEAAPGPCGGCGHFRGPGSCALH